MSQEQRQHARYPVELAGEVQIGAETLPASTQNLSGGGVAVLIDREVAGGAKLRVTLFLTQDGIEDPDVEPFEVVGAVRWVAEREDGLFAVGLQFAELEPAQAQLLGHFLSVLDG